MSLQESDAMEPTAGTRRANAQPLTAPLLALLSVAAGTAVGNLYWAQPLLAVIGRDLALAPAGTAWLVTATQSGYAVGVFLFVPLGDVVNRRRFIPATMTVAALALLAAAAAPSAPSLIALLAMVGLASISGQLLAPLANDLAQPERRGRTSAVMMAGFLSGILGTRLLSGVIADALGWRATFLTGGAITVVLACLLAARVPSLPSRPAIPYRQLLGSVLRMIVREPRLHQSLVFGAMGLGTFTMFWTVLTFRLSAPPYEYSPAAIGLFGLAGLVGASTAQIGGVLHDRGHGNFGLGIAWAGAAAAWITTLLSGSSVMMLIFAIVLLDAAIQLQVTLNSARIFSIDPTARSRLNTAFITGNFIGGTTGSVVGGLLWNTTGWTGVAVCGAAASLVVVAYWGLLQLPSRRQR